MKQPVRINQKETRAGGSRRPQKQVQCNDAEVVANNRKQARVREEELIRRQRAFQAMLAGASGDLQGGGERSPLLPWPLSGFALDWFLHITVGMSKLIQHFEQKRLQPMAEEAAKVVAVQAVSKRSLPVRRPDLVNETEARTDPVAVKRELPKGMATAVLNGWERRF